MKTFITFLCVIGIAFVANANQQGGIYYQPFIPDEQGRPQQYQPQQQRGQTIRVMGYYKDFYSKEMYKMPLSVMIQGNSAWVIAAYDPNWGAMKDLISRVSVQKCATGYFAQNDLEKIVPVAAARLLLADLREHILDGVREVSHGIEGHH